MNYRKAEAKDAARAQFRGLWTAITTPFTPDGALDEAGLRRNMRHVTDGLRIDGVFCTGVMGEFWALTREERKRVVEIVVEEARGKCKVIAHTAHHSAHETVELTRHAEEAGADFATFMNPYYPPVNEAMIYDWFEFVASRVNIGIWIFDSAFAPCVLSPELTARIAGIENVCGAKISRPLDHYAKVRRLCGDRIVLSNSSETEWLTLMRDYGQQVHQSTPTPYLFQTPGWLPLREYTELGLAGRYEEAAAVSKTLQPVRAIWERCMKSAWQEKKIIPIAHIKAWSGMLGMAAGPVRTPLLQLGDAEHQALRADLERVGLLARARTAKAA
jgi:4-hydroxy-tetrahydrodipicolinate synthase